MVHSETKKILVINQYYWPDKASTGQILTELCEDLSAHFKVTALVGTPSYSADPRERVHADSVHNNVRIVRAFNTSFRRGNILGRLSNYLSFMISALLKAIFMERHDVVLVMSDPPTVNFIGFCVKALKGSKLVQICQDIYPELAIELKQADNPLLIWLFTFLNRLSQKNCDVLVAISDCMKNRLMRKGLKDSSIMVIENWIDCDLVTPVPRSNGFSKMFGLDGRFVVMHSGNIGLSQNLALLLDAAEILKEKEDILFAIVGDGAALPRLVKQKEEKRLGNVVFIPYQPKKELKYSLCSADLHFLSLKEGLSGLIVPSKIYGIMAAARPIIAQVEMDSDIARMLDEFRFGTNIGEPSARAVAKGILDFYSNRSLLDEMGKKARDAVVKRNSRKIISEKYIGLFSRL